MREPKVGDQVLYMLRGRGDIERKDSDLHGVERPAIVIKVMDESEQSVRTGNQVALVIFVNSRDDGFSQPVYYRSVVEMGDEPGNWKWVD